MATPQNDGIREKILYSAAALLEEKHLERFHFQLLLRRQV